MPANIFIIFFLLLLNYCFSFLEMDTYPLLFIVSYNLILEFKWLA